MARASSILRINVLGEFELLDRVDLVAIAKEKQEEGEKLFRPGQKKPHPAARLLTRPVVPDAHP